MSRMGLKAVDIRVLPGHTGLALSLPHIPDSSTAIL